MLSRVGASQRTVPGIASTQAGGRYSSEGQRDARVVQRIPLGHRADPRPPTPAGVELGALAHRVPLRRRPALPGPPPHPDQPRPLADMTGWKPGDLLLIGAACSVQFAGERALLLRLVS